MRDRETGSLWQHATGEALIGPQAGVQLEPLGGELTTWAVWRRDHPHTELAVDVEKWPGLLPKEMVKKVLAKATRRSIVLGLTAADRRLARETEVIGVSLDGQDRAYPVTQLRQAGTLHDRLGGHALVLTYDAAGDGVQVMTAADNGTFQPIPIQRTRWAGWFEFHPQTDIFNPSTEENL